MSCTTHLLTLETRSYDILVVTDQGYPMYEFKGFKLRKAASGASPKRIRALSLTTEPVRIPPTVVFKSRFFRSQDEHTYEQLYRALDCMALRKLRRTLERRLPCGNSVSAQHSFRYPTYLSSQVDRTRYLERLTSLARDRDSLPILEDSDFHEQELRWPAFFEVTRRIEEVHEDILQSSQVCFKLQDYCRLILYSRQLLKPFMRMI